MAIKTINPATEELIATYKCCTQEELNENLQKGYEAYLEWRRTDLSVRTNLIAKVADLLAERTDSYARIITSEMGKPIKQAIAEVEKCRLLCAHYVEHAERYLAPYHVKTSMKKAKVCYCPIGLVLCIMPWNFPFWQVFRFLIPNLIAGNGVVLKHAPISSGAGKAIEQLMIDAGLPLHLMQQVIVSNDDAEKLIEHPLIMGVSLTGSGRAGSSVAACAGKNLKKTVLELGGSDPCIVLEDANLEKAAQHIVVSRLTNSGQVCVSAKRIIVIEKIAAQLIELVKAKMAEYIMGDPFDSKTQMGPIARKDLRDALHKQVEKTVKQGAKLLVGGIIPEGVGFYYPPTLLVNVQPHMCAFDEEVFGPVIAVCTVADEAAAIKLANASEYGLGAVVFTADLKRGERIATNDLEAGICFVNNQVFSDPSLPFGGTKRSGYGRELAKEGLLEFVNTKTVVINE